MPPVALTDVGPFTTVARVKRYLSPNPVTISDQGLLDELIRGASQAFRSLVNRDILSADYEEVRDGTGTSTMVLSAYPVTAVSSVQIGAPLARVALVANVDYIFSRTAIKLLAGRIFPVGNGTVYVAWTAGFAETPEDIADVVTKTVALRYKQLQRLGQTNKSMGGESVGFDLGDFPKDVQRIITNYSKVTQT